MPLDLHLYLGQMKLSSLVGDVSPWVCVQGGRESLLAMLPGTLYSPEIVDIQKK